jgi:hypothetical protein
MRTQGSHFASALILPILLLLPAAPCAAQSDGFGGGPKPESSPRRRIATIEELAAALAKQKSESGKGEPEPVQLPPLPGGVEELRFDEFYKMPVGPMGLEPTEKLASLNGKRVRILGYMADIRLRNNRQMLFAPLPLRAQPLEYGQADDIPATHVLVRVPGHPAQPVPFTPGLMLLTGTLSVGGKSLDGEKAYVRLLLDAPSTSLPPSPPPLPAPASALKPSEPPTVPISIGKPAP